MEEALDDESDSDRDRSFDNTWLGDDARVKHDMVVKVGTGKKQSLLDVITSGDFIFTSVLPFSFFSMR